MEEEKSYQVPPEGSLGLLALGHIGLFAWRNARAEDEKKTGKRFQSFYLIPKNNNATALAAYINENHES
ncbi:MAG TPA: hypothetical protein PLX60_13935 [Chitinophagales bacterium]|mgnify:FL=1|jgi:hypothetical protein|nr:hypothetical protein [Chitinophagales bacterium]